jgi:hypothetical protein
MHYAIIHCDDTAHTPQRMKGPAVSDSHGPYSPLGAVAKWSGRCPDADREGGPQPCSPDLSGACEGLGDDHRIRVPTPEGEHPALAFA